MRQILPIFHPISLCYPTGSMSSVGPTDGSYQYYQNRVEDLEEDQAAARKKQKTKQKEQEERLHKNQESNIRRAEKRAEEAIKHAKNSGNAALSGERDKHQAEIDQFEKQIYDRNGRFRSKERELEDREQYLKDQIDSQREHITDSQKDLEDRHRQQLDRVARTNARQTDKSLTAQKETYEKDSQESAEKLKDLAAKERDQHQKNYNTLNQRRLEEYHSLKNRSESAYLDLEQQTDGQVKQAQDILQKRHEQAYENLSEKATKDTDKIRQVANKENSKLRRQVGDLLDRERNLASERSESRVKAYREVESGFLERQDETLNAFKGQMDDLKRRNEMRSSHLAHSQDKSLKEKDAYYTHLLKKENLNHHSEQKEMASHFDSAQKSIEAQAERKVALAEARQEAQTARANVDRENALKEQAKAYNRTLRDSQNSHSSELDRLKGELQHTRTSDSVEGMSPAAEEKLRNLLRKEHGKQLEVETEKNKENLHITRNRMRDHMLESQGKAEAKETRLRRDHTVERDRDRQTYHDQVEDLEFSKTRSLSRQDAQHLKMSDEQLRTHGRSQELLRRQYDELLDLTRDDARDQLSAQKKEFEFQAKMDQRSFSVRQNELIREYEKKLADQRAQFDIQIDDARSENQRLTRDGERQLKKTLEEQENSHQRRLAQIEQQHQERERILKENYEDQLEKMRRSHALLQNKKS